MMMEKGAVTLPRGIWNLIEDQEIVHDCNWLVVCRWIKFFEGIVQWKNDLL